MGVIEVLAAFALGVAGGYAIFRSSAYVEGYRDGLKFAEQCDRLIELGRRAERSEKP